MFSQLRQGSKVYILQKPSTFKIGTVTNINNPNQYSTYMPSYTIDISVKCEDGITDFKQLPSQMGIIYYDNGNTVISDNKDLMISEVETMIKSSKELLQSIPYHESIITNGEDILKQLNPVFAQQKDQEDKINILESKVVNMEDKLDNIANMLTKALNK